jgi:dihydrofolate reductase
MTSIRVDMTMSLDGYVTGPQDNTKDPMGIGGFRIFNWLDRREEPGPSGQVFSEAMATRAVISGRRTYEHAGRWDGDHHDGVPVFVLTHNIPDDPPPGSVQYVTDVHDCASQARAAAGDGDVVVMGAGATQALCGPGSSTSSNCTSYRSCSGRDDASSTTCRQNRSSSTWYAG